MKQLIKKIARGLIYKGFFNFIPDKQYLQLSYFAHTGKKLNLKRLIQKKVFLL